MRWHGGPARPKQNLAFIFFLYRPPLHLSPTAGEGEEALNVGCVVQVEVKVNPVHELLIGFTGHRWPPAAVGG